MMMETSTYSVSVDLVTLETILQQRLQAKLGEVAPLQVNCYVKQETVLVVVQHPAPMLAHPNRAFRLVEQVFQEEAIEQQYRGLVYLKVQGRSQPYAFHTYQPSPPTQDVAEQVRRYQPEGEMGQWAAHQASEAPQPPALPASQGGKPVQESSAPSEIDVDVVESSSSSGTVEPSQSLETPHLETEKTEKAEKTQKTEKAEDSDLAFAPDANGAPTDTPEPWLPQDLSPEPEKTGRTLSEKVGLSVIIAGIILGIVVFVNTLYVLTRPCVLGSCESLGVAEDLAAEAVDTVQTPTTGQAILQAQKQLKQAIALLEAIPNWSGRYEDAQALLDTYHQDEQELDRLVAGLKSASKAANLSQNPPLPAEQWEQSAEHWQTAIARLETIPPESAFYSYTRQKVREYRRNLRMIKQRQEQEEAAVADLAAAQEAAKIAQVRQNIAQTLADLQLAYATWQTAINRLEAIPPNTTPYAEAQDELAAYQSKLEKSEELKNREVLAKDAYSQATSMAQLAQAAEKRNQWTEATRRWREALNYIQQVPSNTLYSTKTQPLMEQYAQSLTEAQSRLQESLQVRQAREELEEICSGEMRICVYSVTEKLLSVRLTPTYIEKVRQNARQARNNNNIEGQVDILDHVFALEQGLIRVSDRTGIPLEIYTQDNILAKRHTP
ncbi:MAG: hypothetical protein F6K03_04865 [Kamptonema sp. SIO4C4]|nr:hypothetical protein [Kamptonema sp. SIO4C4]